VEAAWREVPRLQQLHRKIFHAFRARNADGLSRLSRQHIEAAGAQVA
jgi:DNA-binding FadR family transcriptional regulator